MRNVYLRQTTLSIAAMVVGAAVMLALIKVFVISAPSVIAGEDGQGGAALFVSKGCIHCHHTEKTDTKVGPGLKGLFERDQLSFGDSALTEENVRSQIMTPLRNMPSYETRLTDDQLDELIEYLKSL
jgi:cytochrome c2